MTRPSKLDLETNFNKDTLVPSFSQLAFIINTTTSGMYIGCIFFGKGPLNPKSPLLRHRI
jgi:hypothetical protein